MKHRKFSTTAGNYVDPAKSKFGKGVPNKNHPIRKTEITEAEFNRELLAMRLQNKGNGKRKKVN